MAQKRVEGFLFVSIIAVFAIGQSIGAVDGAIAKIATAFNISQSTAMYCSTVGSLVSVASGMVMGALNLGAFLCTNFMDLVGTLTGDPLYNTIFLGAAAYAIFGVLLFFFNPFPKAEKPS